MHVDSKHESLQVVIPHLQLKIFTTVTTFHCTTIRDENWEVVNRVNEKIESHNLGPINDVMIASTTDEHGQLVVFNAAIDFEILQSVNTE